MNKFLAYYQKELNFLKQHGKVFANRFPKIAQRLGIAEGESEDPHVSRLIESFALLTSRIHQRLDDDIPDVIEALVSALAPQFLRALPSVCIVMMTPEPQKSGITGKNVVAANTTLLTRHTLDVPCQFQTVYPVTLLPLSICSTALRFDCDDLCWRLQLQFQVWPGATLADDSIRLYLHGPSNAVNTIYTLLCSEINSLTLLQGGRTTYLATDALRAVGFETEEALLTRSARIAPVHILLLDYFWFPQKFSFIDIQLPSGFSVVGNGVFELRAIFNRSPLTEYLEALSPLVNKDFFRLHCTPAVNLFSLRAEPIVLSDATAEYPIVADIRHQTQVDVWAVQKVFVQRKANNRIEHVSVLPLLESQAHHDVDTDSGLLWRSFHREIVGPNGIEQKSFIAFSERKNRQSTVEPEIVTISVMCTNHNLVHQMQYGQCGGDFDLDAPVAGLKIIALTHPTHPISPSDKSTRRWRFISQMSLNHQLLEGEQGVQRLKDILALYNIAGSQEKMRLFSLIQSLSCQPITTRLRCNDPHSLARGVSVTLTFAHDALQEPEYYLACCLLDRLLALYAPVNSFTRLTTCVEHEAQTRRVWPIRAGRLSWL